MIAEAGPPFRSGHFGIGTRTEAERTITADPAQNRSNRKPDGGVHAAAPVRLMERGG